MQEKKIIDQEKLRHSAAHLLAHAVTELFPQTLLTIGPPTSEGYFYDFLPEIHFKESDLELIEHRMHEIARRNLPLTHEQMPKEQARALYKDNIFKLELINDIPGDTVGIARQGDFYDLCRGGHIDSTGQLIHSKLTSLSGSYWRADKKNQALQRIYGIAFSTEQELKEYLELKERAQLYDHRKLGKQLDLFSFHDEGPGFPFFHPKGKLILNIMAETIRDLLSQNGYQEISTPIMLSEDLWHQSGHYAHYKDNMYFSQIDEKKYAIKPMNCPGAILIYRERPHSFRELPLRLAEFGLVHRHELSGVLHGLFRVRSFTQDDGHIFCTPEQIEDEVTRATQLTFEIMKQYGFSDISVAVSTRPDNAMGSDDLWDIATRALKNALDKLAITYTVKEGEGAFYGPKIEFHILDSMKRSWQCGTVQVDFFQPENFDLSYVASGGTKERPVMIHRAIFGSFERFFGMLLEHYEGKLPFWLAPVQIRIMTITDAQKEYAQELLETFKAHGLRAELDQSGDKISAQIKNGQLEKIPWMLVIGNKEVEAETVTLRTLDGAQEFGITIDDILERALTQCGIAVEKSSCC